MKNIAPMLLRAIICIAIATTANYPVSAQTRTTKSQVTSKNTATAKKKNLATAKPKPKATTKASSKTGTKKAFAASKKTKNTKPALPPLLIQFLIKTNPISYVILSPNAHIEMVCTRNVSVSAGGSYIFQSGEVFDGLTAKLRGHAITSEVRYYLTPFSRLVAATLKSKNPTAHISAPLSVYIGGWGKMSEHKAYVEFPDHPDQKAEIFRRKAYGGGVSFGSQFWLKYRKKPIVLCDLSLGGCWVETKSEMKLAEDGKSVIMKRSGFMPKLGIYLGLPLNLKF